MVWALHAVIISKDVPLKDAIKISQEIINNKNRKFMRETKTSFRFRNISKQKFILFKSKKINPEITLIFGKLKPTNEHLN